jgi:hypothetical protein
MDDGLLFLCNETELITMALRQGLPRLRRGLPLEVYVNIVAGYIDPLPEHLSGTLVTRQALEKTIFKDFERVRSQLPGCNGRCTSYACSDGRHSVCYSPNEDTIHS